MQRFTPLYTPSHTPSWSGMKYLRFDKEDYFRGFVFYTSWLFHKRNRQNFFSVTIRYRLKYSWKFRKTRNYEEMYEIRTRISSQFSKTSTRVSVTLWKNGKCFNLIFNCKSVRELSSNLKLSFNYIQLSFDIIKSESDNIKKVGLIGNITQHIKSMYEAQMSPSFLNILSTIWMKI